MRIKCENPTLTMPLDMLRRHRRIRLRRENARSTRLDFYNSAEREPVTGDFFLPSTPLFAPIYPPLEYGAIRAPHYPIECFQPHEIGIFPHSWGECRNMPDVWFGDTLCRNLPPLRESHPIRQCSMLQYIDQEINDFAYMHNWCSVAVENVKRDTVQKMRSICRTRRKPYVSIVRIVSQIDELESSESEDGSTSDFSKIELPACLNSHLVCDTLQLESDDCESLADEPPSCLKELKFIDGICVQDDCARQSFKLLSLDREMSLEALSSIASSEGVSPCRSANRKFEEDETSATTYGSVIEYDVSADRNNAPECFGSGSFLVRGLQRFIQTILRNGNKQENQLLREAKENSIAHLSPIRVHIAAAGNEV